MVAALAVALSSTASAAEEAFPSKPIRLIVPFPAGGPTDLAARAIGQGLSSSLGTPVMVDNRPGGNGIIGAMALKSAPADGYTLMISSLGIAINSYLFDQVPYDINKDFDPLSLVLTVPMVVVVNPSVLPVDNLADLVTYLKEHPTTVNYGSAGSGGSSHLIAEYFKYRTGTAITHIPYKGSAPAIIDLVGGQVQVMFDTLTTSGPFINAGKLRLLAVTTAQRLPQYPDVPTMGEALGADDFEASSWYGMYAPAGTPKPIVEQLSQRINELLKQPEVIARLNEIGALALGSSPEELVRYQLAEQDKWRKVIKAAGIKGD
ncbi:tripartite tricarboxylate transporter substrate binding protein [Verticiella sediminum]|uniref:Tripartite tricarboxylate transporter substrate binding protein n=2 Tax=Verticiella sediminum TaxID=1247510 RepID=A0A556AKQ3_9BURK|nr:tripartite tricarboxylate transporter substrate binding protein [Verticiella sediminum]